MADGRYGDRASYGRSDSIFSDEDRGRERGSYDRQRSGSGDDRGFFQKAGEEVRSWFSDDDDGRGGSRRSGESSRSNYGDYESRGGRSGYGSDYQGYGGSHGRNYGGSSSGGVQSWGQANEGRSQSRDRSESWGGGSDWGSASQGSRGASTSSDYRGGSSPFDDHYRSWRDQQIGQMDREYDEYCRHRQQQFESDFHNWRENRQGQNHQSDGPTPDQIGITSGRTGTGGQSAGSGTTTRISDDNDKGGANRGTTASGGSTTEGGSISANETGTGSSTISGSGARTGGRKSQETK